MRWRSAALAVSASGVKVICLAHVLHHVAHAAVGQVHQVGEVHIRGNVAMPGQGGQFVRGEQGVRLVAAQGAGGAAVVEGVVELAVVDGDEGALLPQGLPVCVPLVIALVHLHNLSLGGPA